MSSNVKGIGRQRLSSRLLRPKWIVSGSALLILSVAAAVEMNTAYVQSRLFSSWAGELTYSVQPGAHKEVKFPSGGPQDLRLGYAKLSSFIESLDANDFEVVRQSAPSAALGEFTAQHGYAIYHEKEAAGLALHDRDGKPFYETRFPQHVFENFDAIPSLLVNTLSFIEDRALLETENPRQNPAVQWDRFALAAIGQVGGVFDPSLRKGGASTLATQIEKFRHYPDGITRGIDDKLHQMLAASMRSYIDGPDTLEARRRIVSTYLNSTPLSSRPGYGEVIGIGDGLWIWFGTDLREASALLSDPNPSDPARRAEIY